MPLKSKSDPFNTRQFILPTSRYIGTPPWSSAQVMHAHEDGLNVPQRPTSIISEPAASPLTKLLKFVWNSKMQILIHSTIIFALLSSAGMEVVSSYQISPPLRYVAQILCQHDPTGYLRHGCDLISLAPSGPPPAIGVFPSRPHPTPARRNYAAHGGGATILREYTSVTHGEKPCTRWPFVMRTCQMENLHINSPNIALEESTEEGDCWEFSGSAGQLAFNMSESISITDIGLDYPDSSLLSQFAFGKTPRNVSVWTLANESDLRNGGSDQVVALPATDFLIRRLPGRQTTYDGTFVRIAQFQYNPSSVDTPTKQFFNITNLTPKLSSRTIIIKIESNFGAPTTCLYWVGIFGEIWSTIDSE